MSSAGNHGYQVSPDDLSSQVTALSGIGERTAGLVTSAGQLAERMPKLGTAPPALHLAMRLRDEAGQSGLTGEITAADTEINTFHKALNETVTGYRRADDDTVQELLNKGGTEE